MNATLLLCLCVFGAALVFALVVNGWRQRLTEGANTSTGTVPSDDDPLVSLLVPVRDGAGTIAGLLQDLHAQRYPKEKVEVIVIDDHGGDGTAGIVRGMMRTWPQLRLLTNAGEGKKAAITLGVREAKGELIILTDADARCGPERVRSIVAHWQCTRADLLLLPVRTEGDGSMLGRFQEDEQAALFGVAAGTALGGSPMLANGANMAFTKAAFQEVGGYTGDRFASGDDVFLLERMKRDGRRISYLVDRGAIVTVKAEPDFSSFWQQRLRWAGKMRGVGGTEKWIGALALLFPFLLALATALIALEGRLNQGLLRSSLLVGSAWLLWLLPVAGLVRDAKKFVGQPHSRLVAVIGFLAFTIYAPVIASSSLFVRPTWKGRKMKTSKAL